MLNCLPVKFTNLQNLKQKWKGKGKRSKNPIIRKTSTTSSKGVFKFRRKTVKFLNTELSDGYAEAQQGFQTTEANTTETITENNCCSISIENHIFSRLDEELADETVLATLIRNNTLNVCVQGDIFVSVKFITIICKSPLVNKVIFYGLKENGEKCEITFEENSLRFGSHHGVCICVKNFKVNFLEAARDNGTCSFSLCRGFSLCFETCYFSSAKGLLLEVFTKLTLLDCILTNILLYIGNSGKVESQQSNYKFIAHQNFTLLRNCGKFCSEKDTFVSASSQTFYVSAFSSAAGFFIESTFKGAASLLQQRAGKLVFDKCKIIYSGSICGDNEALFSIKGKQSSLKITDSTFELKGSFMSCKAGSLVRVKNSKVNSTGEASVLCHMSGGSSGEFSDSTFRSLKNCGNFMLCKTPGTSLRFIRGDVAKFETGIILEKGASVSIVQSCLDDLQKGIVFAPFHTEKLKISNCLFRSCVDALFSDGAAVGRHSQNASNTRNMQIQIWGNIFINSSVTFTSGERPKRQKQEPTLSCSNFYHKSSLDSFKWNIFLVDTGVHCAETMVPSVMDLRYSNLKLNLTYTFPKDLTQLALWLIREGRIKRQFRSNGVSQILLGVLKMLFNLVPSLSRAFLDELIGVPTFARLLVSEYSLVSSNLLQEKVIRSKSLETLSKWIALEPEMELSCAKFAKKLISGFQIAAKNGSPGLLSYALQEVSNKHGKVLVNYILTNWVSVDKVSEFLPLLSKLCLSPKSICRWAFADFIAVKWTALEEYLFVLSKLDPVVHTAVAERVVASGQGLEKVLDSYRNKKSWSDLDYMVLAKISVLKPEKALQVELGEEEILDSILRNFVGYGPLPTEFSRFRKMNAPQFLGLLSHFFTSSFKPNEQTTKALSKPFLSSAAVRVYKAMDRFDIIATAICEFFHAEPNFQKCLKFMDSGFTHCAICLENFSDLESFQLARCRNEKHIYCTDCLKQSLVTSGHLWGRCPGEGCEAEATRRDLEFLEVPSRTIFDILIKRASKLLNGIEHFESCNIPGCLGGNLIFDSSQAYFSCLICKALTSRLPVAVDGPEICLKLLNGLQGSECRRGQGVYRECYHCAAVFEKGDACSSMTCANCNKSFNLTRGNMDLTFHVFEDFGIAAQRYVPKKEGTLWRLGIYEGLKPGQTLEDNELKLVLQRASKIAEKYLV
eukprot:snap_masked-scaffold_1-processed-gene-26.20-mRNA-1 protein AED:1.00 eAED:1.00 QI:0/0/0/0/1/1/4/0/1182